VNSKAADLDESSHGSSISYFKAYDETQYIFDKRAQIEMLKSYDGPNCTLCLTTVFGKGMASGTLDFYRNIRHKLILPVPYGGTSFLGEGDLLSAVDYCLRKKVNGTFIASSGNISFRELFHAAKNAMKSSKPKFILTIPFFFIYVFYCGHKLIGKFNVLLSTFGYKFYSSQKFQKETGWEPKEKIETIFQKIL
jgi:nucleoside-diphosphate-sugar epimerase